MKIFTGKTIYQYLLFALVTTGVFFLIFRSFEIDLSRILNLERKYLFLALLVTLPLPILNALRWKYILGGMGILASFQLVLKIILGTWLLTILPGRVGDFGRALALPENTPKSTGFGSILFEKVIDILVLMLLSTIGFVWQRQISYAALVASALLIVIISFYSLRYIILLSPSSIKPKLQNLYSASTKIALHPQQILKICAVSAINWLLLMTQVYFLFMGAGAIVPFPAIFSLMPLSIFAGLLPITLRHGN